jgi:hypothetical protein
VLEGRDEFFMVLMELVLERGVLEDLRTQLEGGGANSLSGGGLLIVPTLYVLYMPDDVGGSGGLGGVYMNPAPMTPTNSAVGP